MTVSSTVSTIAYAGNSVTTVFAIPFYFLDNSHLAVTKTTGVTVVSLILGTDYTLTGAGVLLGGSITLAVAMPTGSTLTINRVLPIIQTDDYHSHDTFPAETMEKDLDYLTMICQQLSTSIASLAGGGTLTFQNIGAAGASSYAGTSGTVVQLKKIAGGGSTTVTETASQITVSSAATGIDLTIDYPWTGHHSWTKQAKRTIPSNVMKSLEGGIDITDGGILLTNDYVTMFDMRMRTDVSVDGPVDASEGGNFPIYGQHLIFGNCNANGFAGGGIRMQVQTTAVRTFGAPGVVGGYFGVFNNGTDQGAFGVHVDGYHSGTFAGFSHSTYGLSCEMFKNAAGGIVAGGVLRSNGTQIVDYGLGILHTTGAAGFNRGIQIGSPLIANGGFPGGTGTLTSCKVGIDLTWASFTTNIAMQINANDYINLSGQPLAQSAAPINVCAIRWNNVNGNFQVNAFGGEMFGVNMTNGRIRQNGQDAIAMFDGTTNYVFKFASAGKSANHATTGGVEAPPAQVGGYLRVNIDGSDRLIPWYSP